MRGLQELQLEHLVALWHGELPRPGVEPVSLALQGGFLTTGPPGKSHGYIFGFGCLSDCGHS